MTEQSSMSSRHCFGRQYLFTYCASAH